MRRVITLDATTGFIVADESREVKLLFRSFLLVPSLSVGH
jgi:hypothetical protein